jgi:hypothetical protein
LTIKKFKSLVGQGFEAKSDVAFIPSVVTLIPSLSTSLLDSIKLLALPYGLEKKV